MARMPDFEAEIARDLARDLARFAGSAEHAVGGVFRHHQTSAETPAAPATIEPATREDPMPLSADLHALATRLEHFDEDALTRLEAVEGNPKTADAFTVLHALSGFDPGPVFDGAVAILRALAPLPAAPAEMPQAVPAGPVVAGQA